MGESKRKQTQQDETLMTCAGMQTVAGRLQIRWDCKSAATPMGPKLEAQLYAHNTLI